MAFWDVEDYREERHGERRNVGARGATEMEKRVTLKRARRLGMVVIAGTGMWS